MTFTSHLPTLEKLDPGRPIHMAGICGSAMSGLSILLAGRGFAISGTDPVPDPPALERLTTAGIPVSRLQDGSAIPPDTQLVVASAALQSDHPELQAAASRGIHVIKYAQMLGVVMNGANGIAIAGTHGKTTTTSLLVAALRSAGAAPGFLVGGFVPEFNGSADAGDSDIFAAEACEYDRSFLNLHPFRAIVTNIEEDHLDVYQDIEDIKAAFAQFASNIKSGGRLFYCADCPNASAVAREQDLRTLSYSSRGPADYQALNQQTAGPKTTFDVFFKGNPIAAATISLPGSHNVANALAAIAAAHDMGLDLNRAIEGLGAFRGVSRRFEIHGDAAGVTVVDDYAHHPTEIRALLEGARDRFPGRRLVVAFQPHQISRTRLLFDAFAASFEQADVVWLVDIYAARDMPGDDTVNAASLARTITEKGTSARHVGNLEELTRYAVAGTLRPGDVLITVGAGDIFSVIPNILESLTNSGS